MAIDGLSIGFRTVRGRVDPKNANDEFGGLSPREYLRTQAWDVRRSVGLNALIRFGVLKP
jgi:hypothetical protein